MIIEATKELIKEYRAEVATAIVGVVKWIDMDVVNDWLMGLAITLLIVYRVIKIRKLKKKL